MTVAESSVRIEEADVIAYQTIIAFRWRILALVADFFVLGVIESIANIVFGVTHVAVGGVLPIASGDLTMFTTTTDVGALWLAIITLVYFTGLELLFGATVGKWLSGLRVADLRGEPAHPVSVLVRNLVRLVDWLPFLYVIGGFAALSSPLRQRLGDRLAGTVVVTRESLSWPPLSRTQRRWRLGLLGIVIVGLLGYSAGFFYYGRPPLVVQSAINTGVLAGTDGVKSYTLGKPKRGTTTITYPIHYQTSATPRSCTGTVTLRWTGFPGGWQLANTATTCSQPA
jgi:uncharacterized RDD family membrane protein YckC